LHSQSSSGTAPETLHFKQTLADEHTKHLAPQGIQESDSSKLETLKYPSAHLHPPEVGMEFKALHLLQINPLEHFSHSGKQGLQTFPSK
jgi:hypothetical protein